MMDRWMDGCTDRKMNGGMDGWREKDGGWMDGIIERWMGGWMGRQVNGWMPVIESLQKVPPMVPSFRLWKL